MALTIASPPRPASAARPGYVCPECDATVEAAWPGEAELLAGLHNDLVHYGRYTAKVTVTA